jgi:hypothetical protein
VIATKFILSTRLWRVRRVGRAVLLACALALASQPLLAQRPDSTAAAVDTTGPKPERQPPISPRRAFLYSLLLPGYAQSVLGRGRAGTLQLSFESVALVMIRISAADIREARRNVADSIPVSFVDANGAPNIRYERTPFPTSLVKSRRAHLEDWIAVLIANHLFAAADAYVAALLWDLPSEVALRATPRSAELAFRVYW